MGLGVVATVAAVVVLVLLLRRYPEHHPLSDEQRIAVLEREIGTQYVDRYVNLAQELEEISRRVAELEATRATEPSNAEVQHG